MKSGDREVLEGGGDGKKVINLFVIVFYCYVRNKVLICTIFEEV